MEFKFRKLTDNDGGYFRKIAEIHESLPLIWIENYTISEKETKEFEEQLIKRHGEKQAHCEIVEVGNEMVAYLWAETDKKDPEMIYIWSIWVAEQYRKNNLASSLIKNLEKFSKTLNNIKRIIFTTSANNLPIKITSEKLGYTIKYYEWEKNI